MTGEMFYCAENVDNMCTNPLLLRPSYIRNAIRPTKSCNISTWQRNTHGSKVNRILSLLRYTVILGALEICRQVVNNLLVLILSDLKAGLLETFCKTFQYTFYHE